MTTYAVGCDIGGTFTDTVVVDRTTGEVEQYKSPTTIEDLREGILATLRQAAEAKRLSLSDFLGATASFSHGTTVATNALLERRGAKTGLIQTRGFGDTIFIMRAAGRSAGRSEEEMRRFSGLVKPTPIVTPQCIAEVDERVDLNGKVLAPLQEADARRAIAQLLDQGVESIAICLLWAFRNREHEDLLARLVAEMAPEVFVSVSSDLIPRIKEYERTTTTTINSYVGPRLRSSLASLETELEQSGLTSEPLLMQSTGGLAGLQESIDRAATTLLSGPAGGVAGSAQLGEALGYRNIVTTDMGGTTFDVALVVDGRPLVLTENIIGQYTVGLPSIGITAVGAGGGSIARVRHGYLSVGPESAGAAPGPACYGRGGLEPTVTDANVVLGIIDPDSFLGGTLRLDRAAAETAMERVATPLGLTVQEAAAAVRTVTDAKMADLIRGVTIERGHDPRDFVLFAFGGGGPTHASSYGSDVGVAAIVVPSTAAVHSAMGIADADLRVTLERSEPMAIPVGAERASEHFSVERLNAAGAELAASARDTLRRQGAVDADIEVRYLADMRLRGQIQEMVVELPPMPLDVEQVDAMPAAFVKAYEEHFGAGSAFAGAGVELMTLRVEGMATRPKRPVPDAQLTPRQATPRTARTVYLPEKAAEVELDVYDGSALQPGDHLRGPAVIELPGTTVLVGLADAARVDHMHNIVIERSKDQ